MADGLTATAESGAGRVLLRLEWAGVTLANIVRVHADGSEYPVRNAEPALNNLTWVQYDHDAPLDRPVSYRATSVQVTPATGGVVDTFTRTVSNGWGVADTGQAWTTNGGVAADYSVGTGTGQHSVTSVAVFRRTLLVGGATDVDIPVDVAVPVVPAGAGITVRVAGRLTDINNYYAAELSIAVGGATTVRAVKLVAGTLSNVSSTVAVGTHAAGNTWRVRLSAIGTSVRVKAWRPATDVEPPDWQAVGTDSDPALTAGTSVGLMTRLDTGNTNTLPVAITFDNLSAVALNPLTSNSVTVTSGGSVWLKHPGKPWLNRRIIAREMGTRQQAARRGVLRPIGRPDPIVIHDVRGTDSGTLIVGTEGTQAEIDNLRAMVADGVPLLMQTPDTWGGESLYISVDTTEIAPVVQYGPDLERRFLLPFDVIGRPPGACGGPAGLRWDDVPTGQTWNTVTGTWDDKASSL